MAWLDDRIQTHPKVALLTDRAFRAWVNSLCYSSMYGTRGNVDVAINVHRIPKIIVRELVRAGLWEEHEDGLWIHDWGAYNDKRDEQVAKRRAFDTRRQQLMRDPELRAAIRERDGDHCRYCGREVNWLDRKGIAGATYDHVDPAGPNTIENLVVCCRSCNSIKRGRSIEDAGMRLRPLTQTAQTSHQSSTRSRTDLDPDLDRSRTDLDRNQVLDLDPSHACAQAGGRTRVGARPKDHDHDQDQEEKVLRQSSSVAREAALAALDDDDLEKALESLHPSPAQKARIQEAQHEEPQRLKDCLQEALRRSHRPEPYLDQLLTNGSWPAPIPDIDTLPAGSTIDATLAWRNFISGYGWDDSFTQPMIDEELRRIRASNRVAGYISDQDAISAWRNEYAHRYPDNDPEPPQPASTTAAAGATVTRNATD